MSKLSDLLGTISSYFRIGIGSTSIRLKNVSGTLQIRNAGDTVDADLKANTLSVANAPTTRANLGINNNFDYDQSTVPSSPTNGQRWREWSVVTGLPIEVWIYDSANARWVSDEVYSGFLSGTNIAATTTLRVSFGIPTIGSGLILTYCEAAIGTGTAHSALAYYTISFQSYGSNAATALSGVSTPDTKSLTTSGAVYNASPNLFVSGASSWAVTFTKVGLPANINYSVLFQARRVR